MAFSHRMASLAAVVVIPLGIAATSYALTDRPDPPTVPPKVELSSGTPTPPPSGTPTPGTQTPTSTPAPTGTSTADPAPTPSDEIVSRPPVQDVPSNDDDDDDDGPSGDD
jgi:hypothetical protein